MTGYQDFDQDSLCGTEKKRCLLRAEGGNDGEKSGRAVSL